MMESVLLRVFKTVFGEDWMPMPETIGEDNNLRLVVTVS